MSTPSTQYQERVDGIRRHLDSQTQASVEAMLMLLDLYDFEILWRPHYNCWKDFLKEEGFGTLDRFNKFKSAHRKLGLPIIRKLGVQASNRIVAIPVARQEEVLHLIIDWYDNHRTPPTYQLVTGHLKDLEAKLGIRLPKNTALQKAKGENKRLQKENVILKERVGALRKQLEINGLKPVA